MCSKVSVTVTLLGLQARRDCKGGIPSGAENVDLWVSRHLEYDGARSRRSRRSTGNSVRIPIPKPSSETVSQSASQSGSQTVGCSPNRRPAPKWARCRRLHSFRTESPHNAPAERDDPTVMPGGFGCLRHPRTSCRAPICDHGTAAPAVVRRFRVRLGSPGNARRDLVP